MDGYHIPSFADWKEQDVMNIKVYQDSQGNKVYGFTDGGDAKTAESRLAMYEPMESMDGGGGGETWQEGLRRLEKEMEIDMLRFELEDAVLDPETNTEEGAAFGKANVAPASASLVDRPPFVEPFDKGQSHTYHKLKTNKLKTKRLQRKDLDRFLQDPPHASLKEAMDLSQK